MSGLLAGPPLRPGGRHSRLVMAIEQGADQLEIADPVVCGAVAEDQHLGSIGGGTVRRDDLIFRRRQEDRLAGSLAIPGGAVRKEGFRTVGPEQGSQGLY